MNITLLSDEMPLGIKLNSWVIYDLLWWNREQVACDIQLILGLSTDQEYMVSDNRLDWLAYSQFVKDMLL